MPVVKLTPQIVRTATCPAGKRKVDLFDSASKGLLLEVRETGGKTYYQRYQDPRGRGRQLKIGPAELLSLSEAKRRGREIARRVILGADPQAERMALREVPTFAQFVTGKYLPHAMANKRSWRTDDAMLRNHLVPALGRLHMDEVRAEHIDGILSTMRTAGYAPGTVGRALVLARHIFNLAQKWKTPGVSANPTAGFSVPPDVPRNRYLTKDEAARLLAASDADENKTAAKVIKALLLTGARRNEISQAKWDYIDWTNRTLLVPVSKSGRPRNITLSSAALDLFRSMERVPGNPYIFPAPSTGRPSPHLFFPWDRIRKRAGLEDVRLHDLRHSFASFLVNDGVSLYRVQRLLGHSNAKSTARYSHLSSDTLNETADSLARMLGVDSETRDDSAEPHPMGQDVGAG